MIGATIIRLRDVAMPPLLSVDGAEELEALAAGTAPRHGAAFVMPYDERGQPNDISTGSFRQLVDVQLVVAVVLRQHDDAKGAKRVSAIDAFRNAIEAGLAGWTPDDAANLPFEFVAARSAPQSNGVTWYVQTWRTNRWIEA